MDSHQITFFLKHHPYQTFNEKIITQEIDFENAKYIYELNRLLIII